MHLTETKKRTASKISCPQVARPAELESTTFWSVARRSIQLSYGRIFRMAERVGFEPTDGKTIAGFQDRCLKPTRPSFRVIQRHGADFSTIMIACQCFFAKNGCVRKPIFKTLLNSKSYSVRSEFLSRTKPPTAQSRSFLLSLSSPPGP